MWIISNKNSLILYNINNNNNNNNNMTNNNNHYSYLTNLI